MPSEDSDAAQRRGDPTSSPPPPTALGQTRASAPSRSSAPKIGGSVPLWAHAIDRAIVPVSIAVILGCAALVVSFDYGRDQAIYAVVAREILAGRMPYRDAFDFKPPGIFLVYAFARAVFGSGQHGIRILEALSMLGTSFGLVRLARLHFGDPRSGWIAASLASQVHAQLDFWHTGQPETFGGTLTIVGLLAATAAQTATNDGRRVRALATWLLAGFLFGLAGLMKPPLAGAGAVVATLAALASVFPRLTSSSTTASVPLGERLTRAAMTLAVTAVGGALPFALTLAWFQSKGALGDLYQVLFVFTPYYTKLGWENARVLGMAYYGFSEWLVTYSGALLFGLVALVATRPTRREAPYVVTIGAIILVHIAGVVMQGKFFPYHWGATFPLTATLAGLGIDKALRFALGRGRVTTAALLAVFTTAAVAKAPVPNLGPTFLERAGRRAAIFVRGPMDEKERDALASVADVDAAENRAVGLYLSSHTPSGAPVFVWGFECVIYDIADRPLASRYIYDVPQRATWSAKPMQEALMRELAARPPVAIVVEHNDVFPMVTGNNDDSARSLMTFDGLDRLIDDRYALATRIGDFDVYLQRSESAEADPPRERTDPNSGD